MKKKLSKPIKLLIRILSIFVIIFLLLQFVIGVHIVHDNNMYPKVVDGDLVITYKLSKPYTGDIVLYEADGVKKVGRVVGVEGDIVNIDETGYTVNNLQPYEVIYYKTIINEASDVIYPYAVEENEVFVLNDMRDDMRDSRLYGGVDDLYGTVIFMLRNRGF